MRKFTLLILLVIAAVIPAVAQQKGKDRDAMRREVHEFNLKFLT